MRADLKPSAVSVPAPEAAGEQAQLAVGGDTRQTELEKAKRRRNRTLAIDKLRASWIALICLPLAAIAAYKTTMLAFALWPEIDKINAWNKNAQLWNDTHSDYDAMKLYPPLDMGGVAGGYMFVFVLYLIGSGAIDDRRIARVMTTLPFVALAIANISYIAWQVLFGAPDYIMLTVQFLWGTMITLVPASCFWEWFGPPELGPQTPSRPLQIAKSKFAERQHSGISDTEI